MTLNAHNGNERSGGEFMSKERKSPGGKIKIKLWGRGLVASLSMAYILQRAHTINTCELRYWTKEQD